MLSILLLSLAALSRGSATQSLTPCSQATFTIDSAADATALSQCSTLDGNVVLGKSVTEVDLSGPVAINGDLSLADGDMIDLSSTTIKTISGTFSIRNATILSALSFSSLTSVGSLEILTAPALSEFGFDSGIASAETVHIESTFLRSLKGLSLTQVLDLNITQNTRLVTVDLPLVNVTGTLTLVENGQSISVNLPDLITTNKLYLSGLADISLPSLQTVQDTALVDTNYFTSFSAPQLQSCGGELSIINNMELESLLLPQLSSVAGSLYIANNSRIKALDGLDNLKTVNDDVDLGGNFTDVELPSMTYVGGNLEVSSSHNITDSCASLQRLAPVSQGGGGQVHGTFDCASNNDNVNPETPGSSITSMASGSSTSTSNAVPNSSSTSPISGNATPTSSTTPTTSSAGSQTRSKTSKCGVYLIILTLSILT